MLRILTSESVNIGHPDKTCDTIADAFLDEALRQCKNSQMAVECAIKDNLLMIYGEATTDAKINYVKIAREILRDIGYKNKFKFIKQISKQSTDINQAVVKKNLAANDQGMAYGFAIRETKELMPYPIMIAHKLMLEFEKFRQQRFKDYFADAKSQVSVAYEDQKPLYIHTVLMSVSHRNNLTNEEIKNDIKINVVEKVLAEYKNLITKDLKIIINPSDRFTIWGSFGDSGCVGRKIVVDTYGGVGRVGGGCFSSKNATKVDRSGAYYARYIAKNIVANNLADKCEVCLSFGIGLIEPISIDIECFGTNNIELEDIYKIVHKNFNFRIENIIKELDLLTPIYKTTACYGHFGREQFSWERIKELNR